MTKKVKMKKRVPKMSAWAVVGEKTMSPWGNGYEFQYPIFHTRIEDFNSVSGHLVVGVKSYENVSDGYHTIEELYDHRITLYIALCRFLARSNDWDCPSFHSVWRSKLHHDGTKYDGWFMLAIGKETGKQITYHLPLSRWEETNFAETYERAPVPFDGHTSADVLERLKCL